MICSIEKLFFKDKIESDKLPDCNERGDTDLCKNASLLMASVPSMVVWLLLVGGECPNCL